MSDLKTTGIPMPALLIRHAAPLPHPPRGWQNQTLEKDPKLHVSYIFQTILMATH